MFKVKPLNLDNVYNFKLKFKDDKFKVVQRKNKRFSPEIEDFLNKKIPKLLSMGVISPSESLNNISLSITKKPNKKDFLLTLNLILVDD